MTKEYNYHAKIMGCDFDMTFIADNVSQADKYFLQASNIAKFYERKFSRFINNSELTILNNKKQIIASKEFLEVYSVSQFLHKITKGKFNSLMQVAEIGYDKSFEKLHKNKSIQSRKTDYDINVEQIVFKDNKIILGKTQKLDFNGFLKGYVVQKISQSIKSDNGFIINIGGDMYIKGVDQNQKKFIVEIVHPLDQSKNISFSIKDRALCTSGTYKRKWKTTAGKKHHILNATTRDSAKTNLLSASIIHSNGAKADALATLAISLGNKRAEEFLKNQENLEYVLINTKGDIITSKGIKLYKKSL